MVCCPHHMDTNNYLFGEVRCWKLRTINERYVSSFTDSIIHSFRNVNLESSRIFITSMGVPRGALRKLETIDILSFRSSRIASQSRVPFDTRRLVFPPFPAAVIAFVLYKLLSLVVPEFCKILLVAGALTGYLTYDMIHYYLHYGCPDENSYFYHLKRYHNQHHFAHHDSE